MIDLQKAPNILRSHYTIAYLYTFHSIHLRVEFLADDLILNLYNTIPELHVALLRVGPMLFFFQQR